MHATLTFVKNQKRGSTYRIIKHQQKVKCHTAVQEVPLRACTVSVLASQEYSPQARVEIFRDKKISLPLMGDQVWLWRTERGPLGLLETTFGYPRSWGFRAE